MVLWEAIVVVNPLITKDALASIMRSYCTHVLKSGGVVRKIRNEGVMRLHKGMYSGPVDKRRMYVPRKHEWRIHEPVDESQLFHGRYLVMLFDLNVPNTLAFQDLIDGNSATLEWQIRHRSKHHPLATFKDPHDFEIGHDLQSLSEQDEHLLVSHPTWSQWGEFQSRRWSGYLLQNPSTTEVATTEPTHF
eukprot:TRINITY_DN39403_c0_g1_i1.p1 TRINITY_DN39403_c0_g1~~TRINITY_DN39403_c0_g1_i1.p1  ORF type:complete len:206 (+),score=20.19 TRINITY_DN39403_c0_g1_i1:50-619(+)